MSLEEFFNPTPEAEVVKTLTTEGPVMDMAKVALEIESEGVDLSTAINRAMKRSNHDGLIETELREQVGDAVIERKKALRVQANADEKQSKHWMDGRDNY